jgi:hypothetical protein
MFINGRFFVETTGVDRRGPEDQAARDDSGRTRHFWQPGACGEPERELGKQAFLGYARRARDESPTPPNFRVWIDRALPHNCEVGNPGAPWNDVLFPPVLWASSVEECKPVSGHSSATNLGPGALDGVPVSAKGLLWRVKYQRYPYFHREGADVVAAAGPLIADPVLYPGLPGRPDEGDALRRGFYLYSRFVTKDVVDDSKVYSMPAGFIRYDAAEGFAAGDTPNGIPFRIFRQKITYHWLQVPYDCVPLVAIGRCTHRVNDDTFDGYTPGTLVFDRLSYRHYQGGSGNREYLDLSYHMTYQPSTDANADDSVLTNRGHNAFPRAIGGRFRFWPTSVDGSGDASAKVLLSASFPSLFRPDQP